MVLKCKGCRSPGPGIVSGQVFKNDLDGLGKPDFLAAPPKVLIQPRCSGAL